MSGIGVKRMIVPAAVLDALLRGKPIRDLRSAKLPSGITVATAITQARAELYMLPPDAQIVEVQLVDRNMKGKGAEYSGYFEYCVTYTHPSFESDQENVLPAAEAPQVPADWIGSTHVERCEGESDALTPAEAEAAARAVAGRYGGAWQIDGQGRALRPAR